MISKMAKIDFDLLEEAVVDCLIGSIETLHYQDDIESYLEDFDVDVSDYKEVVETVLDELDVLIEDAIYNALSNAQTIHKDE